MLSQVLLVGLFLLLISANAVKLSKEQKVQIANVLRYQMLKQMPKYNNAYFRKSKKPRIIQKIPEDQIDSKVTIFTPTSIVEWDNSFRLKTPQLQRENFFVKQIKGFVNAVKSTVVNIWQTLTHPGKFFYGIKMLFTHTVLVFKMWRQREKQLSREYGLNYQIGRYFWTFLQFIGDYYSKGLAMPGLVEVGGYVSTLSDTAEIGNLAGDSVKEKFYDRLKITNKNYVKVNEEIEEDFNKDYVKMSLNELKAKYKDDL